ncbi:MAG: GTP pyrophosphokinase [Deltaproteobacteria bacterium CG12_big_fil_rev_8_21_14_0_65_43_10]|nr:MAG: GTP pyrophosphokinase [Deltaproteobacteria bacterium CG12_big_fil_rev_8_21_14_0_65_43_10]PIU84618.1 MAG: GTP pyrophosphokinase [Deltaproteobacteria bacterium CG06_land_8_20_14_3_00_44_19]PIX26348.1 MAG: GTP pyrophosphokinase [Deltaproteobacteria bacterium CG_4_8_14_3_um_filter_43_13]PIZ18835.1 MAG: GTP pyrophosphokinase [Deltaproteobacteria bacterium CG_4_10_14_0_8_um_filter_43_12]PJB44173.1 MAG: GTP pyrophosphokinase [Deltaproteobacteria bacterium CG_4_9_14_3_um_filter_44_9]HCX90470.1
MIRLNDIIDKIHAYNPDTDVDLIEKAYVFSAKIHQGQVRLSGEPYLIHPLEVAGILADLKLDVATIATGLLHDAVEDTYATLEEIGKLFGRDISPLVDGVTKISKITFGTHEEQQAENFRKMLIAMAKDIRVILIKLADRLHNMRTLEYHSPKKQKEIAKETLDIYAPLANRLGIGWVRAELEDLSLQFLEPEVYYDLMKKVVERKKEGNAYIHEVKTIISNRLAEYNLKDHVEGRLKHIYSIYQKMKKQNIEFDRVYDLIAFRIILDSVQECYEALGIIHSLWKPVPGRFKDHIAMPKANMYQSLHTTVIGPHGERVEIQIRTAEMHRIAEEGIASHWKYKEGKDIGEKTDREFAWLRRLLEWQQDMKDPGEFLESVRVDLFPEEVYVFTPKGEVKEFPRGATPLDFAYSIHTDVGHQCNGAKVNGKIVPLKYELKNGDTLEIITSSNQHPSIDWLKIVKTSRAKAKIRHWVKTNQREQSISLGLEICEKEFKKYKLNFSKHTKTGELKVIAEEFGLHDLDDLLAEVGYGKLSVKQIIHRLIPQERLDTEFTEEAILEKVTKKAGKKDGGGVKIRGVEDIMVRFGKCCNPLPGDDIIGYITRGRGVTVHLSNCPTILHSVSERTIDVEWDIEDKSMHLVRIRVVCVDKKGLLAAMSSSIALSEANIINAQIHTTQEKKAVSIFEVEVSDLKHLQNIINSMQNIKGVINVERLRT